MRSFTILFLLAFSFQLSGQGASSTQKTLITKRTATWCPLCGGWGWDLADAIEELELENTVLLKAHYSGDLESQASADITENWNAVYQPEFFVNENRQEVGSTTWSSKIQEIKTEIEDNAKKEVEVGFEINSTISGNTITADVNIEFLENVSGDYYLGVYILEDSISNSQSGRGTAIHNGVLRQEFSGSSFGTLVGSDEIAKGTEAMLSYTLELNNVSGRFFRVLAIVWEKEGDLYKVENIHSVKAGSSSRVMTQNVSESDLSISQVGSEMELTFTLMKSFSAGRIEAYQMNGQKILSMDFNPMMNQNFVSIPMAESGGKYIIVTLIGDNKMLATKKVFLK